MNENCRTCLSYLKMEESVNVNLKILENNSILDLIRDWASIQVDQTDKLSEVICKTCYQTIRCFKEFILIVRKSDIELKQLCKNGGNTVVKDKLGVDEARDGLQDQINKRNDLSSCNPDHFKHLFKNREKSCNKDELKQSLIKSSKRSPMVYKCLKCPKTFKRSHQYKLHMTVHTGEKKYLCTICGKYFSRSYVLIYHMRVHTGEKKFNCNFCNKSFIHPSNLYKHKKIHTNTRNYKCAHCNKSFIQSEALNIHVRRIHTGEKPFLCDVCSKSFSSQSALWVHKQDTHKEKEVCSICNKQFSGRVLKRHIERHKSKEENTKKCICEQCGKDFSSDHNLKQHLLSHNGIKPYASQPIPCPMCNKLYSKRRIKSHICIAMKT